MLSQNFPVPYNPDDDANGLIGTPDLLSLLALFGEDFSAAVVAENQESAVTLLGELNYFDCDFSCKQLPGMWRMAASTDLALVLLELNVPDYSYTWLSKDEFSMAWDKYPYYQGHSETHLAELVETSKPMSSYRCYCSIKEIPKVEYSFCRPTTTNSVNARIEFSDCCSDKTQNGWFPIPGSTTGVSGNGYSNGNFYGQAFWRWAE